ERVWVFSSFVLLPLRVAGVILGPTNSRPSLRIERAHSAKNYNLLFGRENEVGCVAIHRTVHEACKTHRLRRGTGGAGRIESGLGRSGDDEPGAGQDGHRDAV